MRCVGDAEACRAQLPSIVLAGPYVLTVVGAAIGEMGYYLLGTAVEVALLATIIR